MSNQLQLSSELKGFMKQGAVHKKFSELLGSRSEQFIASVMQACQSNSMLVNADPNTVYAAAMKAAIYDLPISNDLGFAYIVPYNNRRAGKVEAQFQIGYKGFIQLAQRSGQFKRLASSAVHAGQLVSEDPLMGNVYDWSKPKEGQPIGYVALFQLINGFEAELYMRTEDLVKHAKEYSQSFKKDYGVWKDNFDAMALKTVIKLLLSKQAPLSLTHIHDAVKTDQAVLDENGARYVDNDSIESKAMIDLSGDDEGFKQLLTAVDNGSMPITEVNERYKLSDVQLKVVQGLGEAA